MISASHKVLKMFHRPLGHSALNASLWDPGCRPVKVGVLQENFMKIEANDNGVETKWIKIKKIRNKTYQYGVTKRRMCERKITN